jgi:hypothetical protein
MCMKKMLTIIVVGVLVILILAFIGIIEWELVGIVIAGLGLVTAVPSVFQMFWGRARIDTQFEVSAHGNERMLVIFFQNPPIKDKWLKLLGIKREEVQSLSAEYRISEFGSKKVIMPIHRCRLYTDEDINEKGSDRIVLPPTYSVGANTIIAVWDNATHKAAILPDRIRDILYLDEGYYIVQIIIFVDGQPKEIIRQFVVGKNADDLIWAKAS